MKPYRIPVWRIVSLTAVVGAIALGTSIPGRAVASRPEAQVVKTLKYSTVVGPWLVWNKSTCRYDVAKSHPKTYAAVLTKQPGLKIVYTPEASTFQVDHIITGNFNTAASKSGINLTVLSNEYPSTTVPLQVANQVVTLKPAAVISANVLPALYPAIQHTYEQACIPMVNVFKLAGLTDPAPALQTTFIHDGLQMAQAAEKLINARHWPASGIWVVSCGEPAVASAPGTNLDTVKTYRDTIKKYYHVPSSHLSPILNCPQNNGSEGARVAVSDWLTAHPQAKYVTGSAWNDVRSFGMGQALKQHGFTTNALIAGRDATQGPLEAICSGDPIDALDLSPQFQNWGWLGLSLGEDIAAGKPVPSQSAPPTIVANPKNVAKALAVIGIHKKCKG